MQVNLFMAAIILLLLTGCGSSSKKEKNSSANKLQQYYVQGQIVYKTHCQNCHQEDGTGLGRLIPPLNKSDYLLSDLDRAVCQIKNGVSGSIIVNGVEYNQPMAGISYLTPLEIAQVVTYITNAWDNQEGIYEVKRAEKVLNSCSE